MAKSGYSEEDIKKLKRAKADPVIAPDNGQVLWEVSVEVHPLLLSSDVNISMTKSFVIFLLHGENMKDSDRIYRTCGGDMCTTRC